MISRILHLLMIDILAVGVAMRRNNNGLQLLNMEGDELGEEALKIVTQLPKIAH